MNVNERGVYLLSVLLVLKDAATQRVAARFCYQSAAQIVPGTVVVSIGNPLPLTSSIGFYSQGPLTADAGKRGHCSRA